MIFLKVIISAQEELVQKIDSSYTEIDAEQKIEDSIEKENGKIRYPLKDRKTDFFSSSSENSFDKIGNTQKSVKVSLEYNPQNQSYILKEKVVDEEVKSPSIYDKKEVYQYWDKQNNSEYFKKKAEFSLFLSQRGGLPRFVANDYVFHSFFGINKSINNIKQVYDSNKAEIKKAKKKTENILDKLKESYNDSSVFNKFNLDSSKSKLSKLYDSISLKKKLDSIKKMSYKDVLDKLDESKYVDINPSGFADLIVGIENNKTNNPSVPYQLRSIYTPIFDLKYDARLNSKIGSKLDLPISLTNLSNFDLRNPLYFIGGASAATASTIAAANAGTSLTNSLKNVKLSFEGEKDQIIKQIELGVTSFETKSNIIPSTKELFGFKTKVNLGKLKFSGVVAYQTSKIKTIELKDGGFSKNIHLKSSEYELNKNFLIGHYFRKKFNSALKNIPLVNSPVRMLRVEVWVTNRNATANNTREVIAFSNLGECGSDVATANTNDMTCMSDENAYPSNDKSPLYNKLISQPNLRVSKDAINTLQEMGYVEGKDFEKVYAKKIPTEGFYFHPNLGIIMLNESVTNESIVAISYEYQVDGVNYKVGEFSEDITLSSNSLTKILFAKLLKTISPQPKLPIWKLMMRNVYNIGTSPILKNGFDLSVFYSEPSKGEKIYLPYVDPQFKKTIISLINSDRLNLNNDFMPDGIFDFVENVTVFPDKGKIMFPVLEPFGKDLEYTFTDKNLAKKYLFYALYDSIQSYSANQIENDRFVIKGNIKGSSSEQIMLGVFNITPGSVKIYQSGKKLQENTDYIVDYTIGVLTITNKSILASKTPLTVTLEDNTNPGFQQKNFIGLRAEYDFNKNLTLGTTYTHLKEMPLNSKVVYGQEAIKNELYGFDINYKFKSRAISYFLDQLLPIYVTKEISEVKSFFEIAYYNPGVNALKQANGGDIGSIYIDDFENNFSNISLGFNPLVYWQLSSIPQNATDETGNILFPEGTLTNNLNVNKNRAQISWYQIDPNMQDKNIASNPAKKSNLLNPKWRRISTNEIFPLASTNEFNIYIPSFDIAFFPKEKGQYNFETSSLELDNEGNFLYPEKKMGGISFGFQDQANFEDKNVEYIQFWLQDPFIGKGSDAKGDLYFNLGNISEDILNDNLRMYESGLSTPSFVAETESSIFGKVPKNPTPVSNNFISIESERAMQDVGLDGLNDTEERNTFAEYLNTIKKNFGEQSKIYSQTFNDPTNDNFIGIRDSRFVESATLLDRYKKINNTQGNSQISGNSTIAIAATNIPDKEDLNNDNILNKSEDYFQYVVHLSPNMTVGTNYIVDKRTTTASIQLDNQTNPSPQNVTWYLIKIPLTSYYAKVGNINDFKRIRFMRMFLTNFKEETVLRLVKFSLVANAWRKANFNINNNGTLEIDHKNLKDIFISNVNIEENDKRKPIPYLLPPGITRIQQTSTTSSIILQNEQSVSMRLSNLNPNEAKGIFKSVSMNLNNYEKMKMFIHAESFENEVAVNDNEMELIVRLCTDYTNNYYEISIPLKITPFKSHYSYYEEIWPTDNNLDFNLEILRALKLERNYKKVIYNSLYSKTIQDRTFSIFGNPSLAQIKGILIAVKNKSQISKSIEIWADELRLSDLNQQKAQAGYGSIDFKLADLGTMSFTGSFHTNGFGTIEQKTNERNRDNFKQYNVTANLDLSKMLPDGVKMNIPFYMNISKEIRIPQYDPYDSDLILDDKVNLYNKSKSVDSVLNASIDYTKNQIYSLTNVKVLKQNDELINFYSIKNWEFFYTYSSIYTQNPITELFDFSNHSGSGVYSYNPSFSFYEPFKHWNSKNAITSIIKHFNINLIPSKIFFKLNFERQFTISKSRSLFEDEEFTLPEYYNKNFNIYRTYETHIKLTKSTSLEYKALNISRVDEKEGRVNTPEKGKVLMREFFKGGRNINFFHEVSIKYTMPTGMIDILNWVKFQVGFNSKFNWLSAPDSMFYLGHTILNQNKKELVGELSFSSLYKKLKLDNLEDKPFFSTIFSIKKIRVNLVDLKQSTVNGFLLRPHILGMNLVNLNANLGYSLGVQPDKDWIDKAGKNGFITNSTLLNQNNLQSLTKNINANAELYPIKHLQVILDLDYSFGSNFSELFKDTSGKGEFAHLNPYYTGRFSISYWAFETMFENYKDNEISNSFKNFLNNRKVVSEKLGKTNVNSEILATGYYKGYDEYAQDVLIPSFIYAYTGQSIDKVKLIRGSGKNVSDNPFLSYFPLPSWQITYSGLKDIPYIKKYFSSVRLTSTYKGAMSINEIYINPRYKELEIGIPVFIDPVSNNFVPYYRVPNITISDKFDPYLSIDIITNNRISVRFKFAKERTVSLSLVDFQISENYKEQFGYSLSYKIILTKDPSAKFRKELSFKADILYSQDYNYNVKLNQNYKIATGGNTLLNILPSVEWLIYKNLSFKLFYELRSNKNNLTRLENSIHKGGLLIRFFLN